MYVSYHHAYIKSRVHILSSSQQCVQTHCVKYFHNLFKEKKVHSNEYVCGDE